MNALATDPAIGTETWKTSCFVWIDGTTARNDLTDEAFALPTPELQILSDLKTSPASLTQLAGRWPGSDPERAAATVKSWVERRLVVPSATDEGKEFSVKRVDIETGSHCNARCGFCPQSERPKPKHFMTHDLFDRVVAEIAPYRPVWVALNNFSEPMLDPHFVERCRRLEAHGLKVALFTNATVLKPSVIEYLASSQVLYSTTINFPSDDPEEWGRLMGLPAATHRRTVDNIGSLAEIYKGGIGIVVNAVTGNLERRIERIGALFARFPNVSVFNQQSNTMAGNIQNDLVAAATLVDNPRLGGCARLAAHVHISWEGDVFMCCLDYSQEFKFGNLADASLDEILSGPIAAAHRRQVYGLADAEPNLLCRTCAHIRR